MEQSRGFAIILRTLALDAGIYHGISPVSSGTQHVANGSEGQTADCTYTYVRLVTFDFRLSPLTLLRDFGSTRKAFILQFMGPLMCTINIFFNFISIAFALHSVAA